MRRFLLLISFGLAIIAGAQERDSTILTYESYMELVMQNHPLSRVADIQLEQGGAGLTAARGAFDPVLFYEHASKELKNTDYYSLTDQGLKLPTWFGMEFYAGLERNSGTYLNPENNTPANGLYYAGVSLPVGKGLFIDKRRADLRKAFISRDLAAVERQKQLNELLLEAGIAYWDWYAAYRKLIVFQQAVDVAEQRRAAVTRSAEAGDSAPIDTLEASIQVQNRRMGLQENQLEYQNSRAFLSAFLWQDGAIPLELEEEVIPGILEDTMVDIYRDEIDSLISTHPVLQSQRFKIEKLQVERRYQREQLKPTLNLKYNLLTEPMEGINPGSFNTNDYAFGLEFKIPLLLRKERGQLRMTNLKLEQEQMGLSDYQVKVRVKVQTAQNEYLNTLSQMDLYESNVLNYSKLLDGERRMFEEGESSLFLINSRESSFINAQIKSIEIIAKNRKSFLKLKYNLGILGVDTL